MACTYIRIQGHSLNVCGGRAPGLAASNASSAVAFPADTPQPLGVLRGFGQACVLHSLCFSASLLSNLVLCCCAAHLGRACAAVNRLAEPCLSDARTAQAVVQAVFPLGLAWRQRQQGLASNVAAVASRSSSGGQSPQCHTHFTRCGQICCREVRTIRLSLRSLHVHVGKYVAWVGGAADALSALHWVALVVFFWTPHGSCEGLHEVWTVPGV